MYGAPGRIRTSDRSVRSRVLYPAELQAHIFAVRELSFFRYLASMKITEKQQLFDIILKQKAHSRKYGGERGIRTLDEAINPILP